MSAIVDLELFLFLFCIAFSIYYIKFLKISKMEPSFKTIEISSPPPGPVNLPIIGGIIQIALCGICEYNYETYHRICKKYGKVMGFNYGLQPFMVVEDYEVAKEILSSPDWTSRFPHNPLYIEHTFKSNNGLIFSYGQPWAEIRRFTLRSLREEGFGNSQVSSKLLENELDFFLSHFETLVNKNEKEGVEMHDVFKVPSLNAVWSLITGSRLEYDDPDIQKLLKFIEKGSEFQIGQHPIYAFPILRRFMNPAQSFNEAFNAIYKYLELIIKKRRVEIGGGVKHEGFLQKFLDKIEEERNNPNAIFTENQLLATVADFLAGAIDTSSNSLSFAILRMLQNPHVQKNVQSELDRVVGRDRLPNVYDRPNLPYTEATILEVLRTSNVLPVLSRAATCDTTISGYRVKNNTFAIVNLTQIHRDPEIWENPNDFMPERFLDSNNKVIKDIQLLAFGSGKRICIGQTVAKATVFMFFSSLLHKYSFDPSSIHPNLPTDPNNGFTNSAKEYYTVPKLRTRVESK